MPINDSAWRTSEFFRLLDAKDEAGLRAQWVDDPQAIDEISRGWLRGRIPLEDYFQDNLPHLSDIHSSIDELDVRTWVMSRSRRTCCARPTSSTARAFRSSRPRR